MKRLLITVGMILVATTLITACDDGGGDKKATTPAPATTTTTTNTCEPNYVDCDDKYCYDRRNGNRVNCNRNVNRDICYRKNYWSGHWEDKNGRQVDARKHRCELLSRQNNGLFHISHEEAANDRCREYYGDGSRTIAIGGQLYCTSPRVWNGDWWKERQMYNHFGVPVYSAPGCNTNSTNSGNSNNFGIWFSLCF